MRLCSFRIYNFKSIQDTGMIKLSDIDNITILAGQNESGKSSVLEALNFFENGANQDFEDYYRRLGTHPRIECQYSLNDQELDALAQESGGDPELKKQIAKNGIILSRGNLENDNYVSIEITNPPSVNPSLETENVASDAGATEEPKPAFDFSSFILNHRPKYIFYSSFEESILPNKITKATLSTNQAVADFESVFNVNFTELLSESNDASRSKKLSEVNDKASDNLNTYWSQKIGDEKSDYKFKIEAHPQNAQPEESYINFFIDQGDGYPLHVGQKSKGFQWFSSFNLRLRAHQAKSGSLNDFILLIDEPGQGLHEEAQKDVRKVIEEMASNGVQIIFSTHQPQLLGGSEIDFSRLKLITKDRQLGTEVRNVAQISGQDGFKDALSPIRTALGQITLDVNTFLNGKKTIIVEGITDYYYFKAFSILLNKMNFNFIPPVGVTQIPNIYSILLGWGISSLIIVDGDRAGTIEFNRLKRSFFENSDDQAKEKIYINSGFDGIEDVFSADDFKQFASGILQEDILNGTDKNSTKAADKKEILGRTF